tara:strand:+ start:553 stop:1527 length:975 start_codon:yes stop_codon:yes gene_type:complete
MLKRVLIFLAVVAGLLWLRNTSAFTPAQSEVGPGIISHRGVHQTYGREDMDSETCTATRIHPLTHGLIENTLPSMRAAFDAGATVVELDVHLTPDDAFAVFHDWTLDCRTEASGVTQDTPMSTLKRLDVGYGYTADGGQTFPLRGKGVGLMPTLPEVFEAFPEGRFLINFKSRRTEEGDALAAMLAQHPEWRKQVWAVYGGAPPSETAARLIDGLPYFTKQTAKACLKDYLVTGWTGHVPDSCHDTIVTVPVSHARLMWGWPRAFEARMEAAGSQVVLFGPYAGGNGTTGIDDADLLRHVPKAFGGFIWTDDVIQIGSALHADE